MYNITFGYLSGDSNKEFGHKFKVDINETIKIKIYKFNTSYTFTYCIFGLTYKFEVFKNSTYWYDRISDIFTSIQYIDKVEFEIMVLEMIVVGVNNRSVKLYNMMTSVYQKGFKDGGKSKVKELKKILEI